MSRIVAGLVRSRLVEVTPDALDARRMNIRATAKGKRLLLEGRRLRVESFAAQLERLTSADIAKLDRVIAVLREVLDNWQ
jgi:DNA-binding MarR family transcriptional regulator